METTTKVATLTYENSGGCDCVYGRDAEGADVRVCEMIHDPHRIYGPMFAAAPELLAAAQEYLRLDARWDDLTEECATAKRALRDAVARATT